MMSAASARTGDMAASAATSSRRMTAIATTPYEPRRGSRIVCRRCATSVRPSSPSAESPKPSRWIAPVSAHRTATAAIHLDGLGDSADGLLGRTDVAQRLQTMRDPRLGSYGVVAIAVVLLLDMAALAAMSPVRALAALIIAGALSRLATLWVVALVPYVRSAGLGVAALDPGRRFADLAVGSLTALLLCLLDWRRAVIAIACVALTALLVVTLGRRRIGGATGDVYGAPAELCHMAALLVFAVR